MVMQLCWQSRVTGSTPIVRALNEVFWNPRMVKQDQGQHSGRGRAMSGRALPADSHFRAGRRPHIGVPIVLFFVFGAVTSFNRQRIFGCTCSQSPFGTTWPRNNGRKQRQTQPHTLPPGRNMTSGLCMILKVSGPILPRTSVDTSVGKLRLAVLPISISCRISAKLWQHALVVLHSSFCDRGHLNRTKLVPEASRLDIVVEYSCSLDALG